MDASAGRSATATATSAENRRSRHACRARDWFERRDAALIAHATQVDPEGRFVQDPAGPAARGLADRGLRTRPVPRRHRAARGRPVRRRAGEGGEREYGAAAQLVLLADERRGQEGRPARSRGRPGPVRCLLLPVPVDVASPAQGANRVPGRCPPRRAPAGGAPSRPADGADEQAAGRRPGPADRSRRVHPKPVHRPSCSHSRRCPGEAAAAGQSERPTRRRAALSSPRRRLSATRAARAARRRPGRLARRHRAPAPCAGCFASRSPGRYPVLRSCDRCGSDAVTLTAAVRSAAGRAAAAAPAAPRSAPSSAATSHLSSTRLSVVFTRLTARAGRTGESLDELGRRDDESARQTRSGDAQAPDGIRDRSALTGPCQPRTRLGRRLATSAHPGDDLVRVAGERRRQVHRLAVGDERCRPRSARRCPEVRPAPCGRWSGSTGRARP